MPLTKAEAAQLATAVYKLGAIDIVGHGHMIGRHHVVELIDLYTEEMIEKLNSGETKVTYVGGIPKKDD